MISPFRSGIVPVLTYHSQNIAGNDYASNDQHALASDIQTIIDSGMRVLNLSDLVDWITAKRPARFARNGIVLTCDDAPKFDYEGVVYRDFGLQTSFRSIIQRHNAHITCFAIASPKARAEIGEDALGDAELMTDAWWPDADKAPWASIEQVQLAADSIAAVTGRRPTLFAYPFGESSAYLRNAYLPDFKNEHGMQAAVSTDAGYATRDSNRWNIPRFICGRDWHSPVGFRAILDHAKRSW